MTVVNKADRQAHIQARLIKRYARASRFKIYCIAALAAAIGFLLLFFTNMTMKGYSAFRQTEVLVRVDYSEANLRRPKKAVAPEFTEIVSRGWLRTLLRVKKDRPELVGTVVEQWVLADDKVDQYLKGNLDLHPPQSAFNDWPEAALTELFSARTAAQLAGLSDLQLAEQQTALAEQQGLTVKQLEQALRLQREIDTYPQSNVELAEKIDKMRADGLLRLHFNTRFFSNGDSKIPEMSGLASATIGTLYVLFLTLVFSFPIGVMTAIYLEEYAPDNRWTRIIEININNLAAVPSILFGLLGLAIIINFFGAPRSSALAGGLTLGLMTLPVIIISTRAALRSVPDSIRQAAYGVGCSKWRTVKDHILPLALPGILTGTIIGLAQAMGETAPLLIVGMMAYIPEAPDSFLQPATVLPAQIYTWSGEPERAYVERTAAGILVLLSVLILMNASAVMLRKKFERRW